MKRLPYGRQYLDEADRSAVDAVLRGDWLTCGPFVDQFEAALAAYCGARHVIAFSSGTAAAHAAMFAARIDSNDFSVTSPNTFLASANCAEYVGARNWFADIDAKSYNLDPDILAKQWRAGTRVVVCVDFAGQPCRTPEIAEMARSQNAIVVEDAAHALGSQFAWEGKTYRVGGHPWADMTLFSFHPVKTMTTGEGGAVATDDDELASRCRRFRSHGMEKNRPDEPWHYEMIELGYNYRITDIQAALGLSQLKKLDAFIDRRQEIVDLYNQAFDKIPWLVTPGVDETSSFRPTRVAWHLYVLQFDFHGLGMSRAQVMAALAAMGVGTQVHYIPVHTQPYYQRKYGYGVGDCPVAEAYYENCLSIPLYPGMTHEDVEQVIDAICSLGPV
jgi:perosamine synthetase